MSDDSTQHAAAGITTAARWAGRVISGIAVLFLTFDALIKLFQVSLAMEATTQLGFPAGSVAVLGAVETVCLALYLWPRTALLGAVLWVGYLGGAIATHVRSGSPLFSHTFFPIYVAILLWLGLWLRDARARRVIRDALA